MEIQNTNSQEENTQTQQPAGQENQAAPEARKIIPAVPKAVWIIAIVIAVVAILGGLAFRYRGLVVAATVNGHPISRFAVIKQLEKQQGKDVLDNLINEQLIQNEAKAKGVTVSQDDVNKEIKTYEDQFSGNGSTLDDALKAENMTRDDLKEQIVIRKEAEKILGDKIQVTDAEVEAYLKDNKITPSAGQEQATKDAVKSQLEQQKLQTNLGQLITDLRSKANIKRFVNY